MKSSKCLVCISTLEHLPWGGCEDLWYKTALHALQQGNSVLAVVFRHEKPPAHLENLRGQGAELIFLERPAAEKSLSKKIAGKLFPSPLHTKLLLAIEHHIKKYESVVFLISQAGGFDFAYSYLDEFRQWLLSQKRNYHIVVQNVPDLGFTLQRDEAEKQKQTFANAQTVFFVARRNKRSAERILASDIKNAEYVNNPLNLQETPPNLEYPDVARRVQFAVVAALRCFHKGQDILLQVLSGEEWKRRDWQLNLYGTGPDEEYLHRLAAYNGISGRVRFHGHVTDIATVWRTNHIHILPSLGEGTPLALIESMYCGRPAITTDVGGNTEYCKHLQSGFVADYPTQIALANVMELAWNHREKWQQMGLAARNYVEANYDLCGEHTLYRMLINDQKG